MDELYSKDIRVFASALDLKNNTPKNLIEMLNQLQTGSILNGRVVGATTKGEAIFYTVYGRIIMPSPQKLSNGDKIVLQITHNKNTQLSIISINDKTVKNPKPFDLSILNLVNNRSNNAYNHNIPDVSISNHENIPKILHGQITYLNLSQIAQNSILYKELAQLSETNSKNVVFKVNTSGSNTSSGLFIEAEIMSNEAFGAQLLKTKFGIINVENSKLPIGKKLNLEIINLNNKSLETNVTRSISEFILNNGQALLELQKLINEQQQGRLTAIKDSQGIIKISQDYRKLKELLVSNLLSPEATNTSTLKDDWQIITVPFFYGEDSVVEEEIMINKKAEGYLRFILKLNLDKIGEIQLDGLIKFKENSKIPVNFDIIFRSNQKLEANFEQELFQLFAEAKLASGLGGHLSFDKF